MLLCIIIGTNTVCQALLYIFVKAVVKNDKLLSFKKKTLQRKLKKKIGTNTIKRSKSLS